MNEDELSDTLKNVLEGAIFVLIATVFGRGAGLITEVWIIRLFSQSKYGIFRLSILITMLTGAVATLGFTNGVPRQIGFQFGEEATQRIRETIGATYLLGGIASLLISALVFALAKPIADAFDIPQLTAFLRMFSLAIPLIVLVDLFVAVARGLGDSRPKLYFRTLVPKLGFLAGIAIISWYRLPFMTVAVAWILSYLIATLAAGLYGERRLDYDPDFPSIEAGRDLIIFSLPLLVVFVVNSIGSWIDTIVVGYYKPSDIIGLYSATVLLTRLIPMVLGSVSFMYLPVAARFYAKNEKELVQMIYSTVTKWITGLTLPIFMTFMLFPGVTLETIFGQEFRSGATVMRLLALGFFTHTLLGTNGQSLILIGRRRFFAISQIASVSLNLLVSFLLIPVIGIEGAAIGSAIAYILNNIAISIYLYYVSGFHVISRNHLFPVTSTIILSSILGLLLYSIDITIVGVAGFAVVVGLVHLVIYIKSSSINESELEMIRSISEITGLPLSRIIQLLK